MIRDIHINNEKVLSQRAVLCIPLVIEDKEQKEKKKPTGLTDAVESKPEEEEHEHIENPWLPHILELIQDLRDTAENIAENCLGLASNQIWIAENYGQEPNTPPPAVFIMRWPDSTVVRKWDWKAIINPLIQPTGKTLKKEESCLSFPGKLVTKKRGKNVFMAYQSQESYQVITIHLREMQGNFSQIVQHEMDHLMGKHV